MTAFLGKRHFRLRELNIVSTVLLLGSY